MPASLERTFFVCLNANPLFLNFEPPQEQLEWRRQRGAAFPLPLSGVGRGGQGGKAIPYTRAEGRPLTLSAEYYEALP